MVYSRLSENSVPFMNFNFDEITKSKPIENKIGSENQFSALEIFIKSKWGSY